MYDSIALRRLRRTLLIHRFVQVLLCALLIYMALHFQQSFSAASALQVFRNSLLAALATQFVLFFPLRRLAAGEARREISAAQDGNSIEQLKALRQKRLFGDTVKGALFLAFVTFIMTMPQADTQTSTPVTFFLATAYFSFIASIITYLQCYNFAVRTGLASDKSA